MPFTRLFALGALFTAVICLFGQTNNNQLTSKERSEGWELLFDGRSTTQWIDPAKQTPPGDSWTIEDGCLKAVPNSRITEDLVSDQMFGDFELQWDWRIAPGGNSGLKYRIQKLIPLTTANKMPGARKFEEQVQYAVEHESSNARAAIKSGERAQIYVVGFEFQMIDDNRHPDAKHGAPYQTGALYSIMGPSTKAGRPVGEFNHSLLVVRGEHVEHWLNGTKVVDTTLDTQSLKDNLAHRWGSDSAVYHLMVDQPVKKCPISLQNHGDAAWFRNIKVKKL